MSLFAQDFLRRTVKYQASLIYFFSENKVQSFVQSSHGESRRKLWPGDCFFRARGDPDDVKFALQVEPGDSRALPLQPGGIHGDRGDNEAGHLAGASLPRRVGQPGQSGEVEPAAASASKGGRWLHCPRSWLRRQQPAHILHFAVSCETKRTPHVNRVQRGQYVHSLSPLA